MAVRPLTEDERQALAQQQPSEPPSDTATYSHADGEASYRGKPLNQEEATDADHHRAA